MSKNLEIIIPVFNEGENLIKVFDHLKLNVKNNFLVLLCYDNDNDDLFKNLELLKKKNVDFKLVKNKFFGPCGAVKTGLLFSDTEIKIVYPVDDLINGKIIDSMIKKYEEGFDIVAPSRFMNGGSMKNCPLIKSILVRFASFTLFHLSSIPIEDASNGFRLFSNKIIKKFNIESELGFAYSLELLVKAHRYNYNIAQIPSSWEEREIGKSRFKILKWLKEYLRWYLYGLSTNWLFKKIKK
ncbi:glycosyltransferase family 2 protein [Candidatus Pelagibacter sp.]|nr:glycosyltransferase family 2 protein [Candidatus Pelagibacter sp.]